MSRNRSILPSCCKIPNKAESYLSSIISCQSLLHRRFNIGARLNTGFGRIWFSGHFSTMVTSLAISAPCFSPFTLIIHGKCKDRQLCFGDWLSLWGGCPLGQRMCFVFLSTTASVMFQVECNGLVRFVEYSWIYTLDSTMYRSVM